MRWLLVLTVLLSPVLGSVAPATAAAPALAVSFPMDGATVPSTSLPVVVSVSDFELVPSPIPVEEAGKHPEVNRPNQGHLHFMLDLQPLVVWEKSAPYVFSNVPPGEHQLMVELVNNDHSSLSPQVVKVIRFQTFAVETAPATGAGEGWRSMTRWGSLLGAGIVLLIAGLVLRRRAT